MISAKRENSLWILIASLLMVFTGVYILFNPNEAILALALYIGVTFICIGSGYIYAYSKLKSNWYLAVGITDILVGIIFITNLGITAVTLPIIFACWAMFIGVTQLVSVFQMKELGFDNWSWSAIAGIISILFAFLILCRPIVGVVTISFLMGSYLFISGLMGVIEFYVLKKLQYN